MDKKAEEVIIMDMRSFPYITDYFIVCSGNSITQVKALADAVIKGFKKINIKLGHLEGYSYGQWVLLDYGDVITHVFHRETRLFYSLEHLWSDVPIERITGDRFEKKRDGGIKTRKKKL